MQSKYRSSSQLDLFEKGKIWATTTNVQNQNQKKPTEFDAFWQFSSNVNTMANMNKKQQFKTEALFAKQNFDFVANNNKSPEHKKTNEVKKST